MLTIEIESGLDIPCLEDRGDARVLQHAPAALQDDWMVIDNENFGHTPAPLN
jgi:hypothetical protein